MGMFTPMQPQVDESATESLDQTADTAGTENTDATMESTDQVITRSPATKFAAVVVPASMTAGVDRANVDLRTLLSNATLVKNVSKLANEQTLSAPMVAALEAIPGFTDLVANFPQSSQLDVVPEMESSDTNTAGLESLQAAGATALESLSAQTNVLVVALDQFFDNAALAAAVIKTQLTVDQELFAASDLTNDVLGTLSVTSVNDETFNQMFVALEGYLGNVEIYSSEELRANPEKLEGEIKGLDAVTGEVGGLLGMSMDAYGLKVTDRAEQYQPTAGTFADKDLTTESVNLLFTRANGVIEQVEQIVARKDEIIQALTTAATDMPTAMESDEVTYGALDHTALVSSYATMVTKLIEQSISTASQVLSVADQALDIPASGELA